MPDDLLKKDSQMSDEQLLASFGELRMNNKPCNERKWILATR